MTRMDDLLSAVFYRRSCPAPETLGDYHLGRLAPGDRLAVALHLRECPHCTAELARYAASSDETDGVLSGLVGEVRSALARLVSRVAWATPSADLALAPALRGAPSPQQTYQADGVRVILEVQPALSGYRRKRLLGKVEPSAAGIGADLWYGAEMLDSRTVGQDGYFTFDRLRPGSKP